MKKIARFVLVIGLLGAWALVAIAYGQPHKHKRKKLFIAGEKIEAVDESKSIPQRPDHSSNADLHYPGFMNLIFQ